MPTRIETSISWEQLVALTDASFRNAGYAFMIEDDPDQKNQSKRKTFALVAFGSKFFSPAQFKMSIHSEGFLAIYKQSSSLHTICWKHRNRQSITRFLQIQAIQPALWNAFDYVLQLKYKIAQVTGSVNTASDIFSRLGLKITEKIGLKNRPDVQTTPIEVTTSSSEVADEEQFFSIK